MLKEGLPAIYSSFEMPSDDRTPRRLGQWKIKTVFCGGCVLLTAIIVILFMCSAIYQGPTRADGYVFFSYIVKCVLQKHAF